MFSRRKNKASKASNDGDEVKNVESAATIYADMYHQLGNHGTSTHIEAEFLSTRLVINLKNELQGTLNAPAATQEWYVGSRILRDEQSLLDQGFSHETFTDQNPIKITVKIVPVQPQ